MIKQSKDLYRIKLKSFSSSKKAFVSEKLNILQQENAMKGNELENAAKLYLGYFLHMT